MWNLILGLAGASIIIAMFFITDPLNLFNKEKPKKDNTNNLYDFEKKFKEKQDR